MAKQRPQPKLKSAVHAAPSLGSSQAGVQAGLISNSSGEATTPPPPAGPRDDGPARRPSYFEAVSVYEKALEALQAHHYDRALELLQSVLTRYPEEKELQERVRLYLNVCERHATPRVAAPQSVDERLYASTLAINGGNYDEAIGHLHLVRDEDPDNDHALYMLAVAHAQRGEHAVAIAHLERSIALNPENRALARRDPDLEPLRDDEAFRLAVDPTQRFDLDPRRPLRPRSGR